MVWLRAHLETMPELQAEEAFRESEMISVGAAKLTKAGRDKVVKRWEAALGVQSKPRGGSIRLTGTTRDLELMKSSGMEVRTVGAGPGRSST